MTRDGFVRPVSTAEGYVVRELTVRNAHVECGRMRRRGWKRTEHVLARRGEVIGQSWWLVAVSAETRVYACDGKCYRQGVMKCPI